MIKIIITIITIPRDQEILGWCPTGDSLISWGERSSLALVANPSRDGASIKILLCRHHKPTLSYYEWITFSNEIETNYINQSQLAEQGLSSGRYSQQGNIGHHHANPVISKRRKWTSQDNKIVLECYLLSEPRLEGIESVCWVYGCRRVCFGYQNKD